MPPTDEKQHGQVKLGAMQLASGGSAGKSHVMLFPGTAWKSV